MNIIMSLGIPLLLHMNIYETKSILTKGNKNGHLIAITFLWLFTVDLSIERKHIDLSLGIANLYVSIGMGMT